MKQITVLASIIGVMVALIVWSTNYRTEAQERPTEAMAEVPADFIGDWEATTHTIAGTTQPTTDGISIGSGASEVFIGNTSIQFLSTEAGISKVLVTRPGDEIEMGGGGPRKGICRIDSEGLLEVLEAGTAADDFPLDFSQQQRAIRGAFYSSFSRTE